MADHRRGAGEFRRGKLAHLHQLVVAVAHVVTEHILQGAASRSFGLHIDVAHLAVLIGESGIVAASEHGDRLHGLLEVDIEGPHDRAIDRQTKGRRAGNELGVETGKLIGSGTRGHQLLGQSIKLVEAVGTVAEVVELEIETTLGREAWNRRGLGCNHQATADFGELGIEPSNNCGSLLISATALL